MWVDILFALFVLASLVSFGLLFRYAKLEQQRLKDLNLKIRAVYQKREEELKADIKNLTHRHTELVEMYQVRQDKWVEKETGLKKRHTKLVSMYASLMDKLKRQEERQIYRHTPLRPLGSVSAKMGTRKTVTPDDAPTLP